MAYETYTTEALVCGTKNRNTADRSYLLFTREAGMLFADARSVREERSRQRYALQDFSLLRVSLVKGKAGWKIGSIEPVHNFYQQATSKAARGSVVSIVRLLRRFLHGEVADSHLFDFVIVAISELSKEIVERTFVELVILVRILAMLGYVDNTKLPETIRTLTPDAIAVHHDVKTMQRVERLYTQAVAVSHL